MPGFQNSDQRAAAVKKVGNISKTLANFFKVPGFGAKTDKVLCGSDDIHRNSPVLTELFLRFV